MARAYMSIGEVIDELKGDHPDVTVSKIRFLEAEGLITPQRTASGYRTFYEGDVDRLKLILRMRRDSSLPLRVIRERLAGLEAGVLNEEQAIAAAPITVTSPAP